MKTLGCNKEFNEEYALYKKNRHSVYRLEYHLVVVTKYRHPVLTGDIERRLKEITKRLFEENWKCEIVEMNTDLDHIHILFQASPQTELMKLVNSYKTVTARLLRKEFENELKPYYWKPLFWSRSYFLSTVGYTSEAVIQAYIQNQGMQD